MWPKTMILQHLVALGAQEIKHVMSMLTLVLIKKLKFLPKTFFSFCFLHTFELCVNFWNRVSKKSQKLQVWPKVCLGCWCCLLSLYEQCERRKPSTSVNNQRPQLVFGQFKKVCDACRLPRFLLLPIHLKKVWVIKIIDELFETSLYVLSICNKYDV